MKILLLTLVLILCLPMVASARDLEEVGETVIDTLLGDNGSCPMLFEPYVAKTWEDVVKGGDVRAELSYQSAIDNLTEDNRVNLKVGLEF